MASPKILILDEPSLGLAPIIVKEIFKMIRRIRDEGIMVLLVEQNAKMALSISDRGYVLETGKIRLEGKSEELLNNEEVATGRVDFTSQNHGYAVSREDLPACLIVTHEEINDKSVEGVRHRYYPAFSVQFHPDAAPGPHDASYLFDEFMEMMDTFQEIHSKDS